MVKQYKVDQVEEIKSKFSDSDIVLFVDYRGLNVESVTELRSKLRENEVVYKVYKNTLAKIALKDNVTEDVNKILEGPTAFAFAKDPVSVSKVLTSYSKENEDLEIKGGIYQGEFLDISQIKQLAVLPSKEELLAKLVYLLNAPVSGLVNVMSGPARKLVYALNAVKEQKTD